MTKKLTHVVDAIGAAWLRERLIEAIEKRHYLVTLSLSQVDPMYSNNLFERLKQAVRDEDAAEVDSVLEEMAEFDAALSRVRQIIRAVSAVMETLPEAYGGNTDE